MAIVDELSAGMAAQWGAWIVPWPSTIADRVLLALIAVNAVRFVLHSDPPLLWDGTPQAAAAAHPKAVKRRTLANHIQRIVSFFLHAPTFFLATVLSPVAFDAGVFVYCLQAYREFIVITREIVQTGSKKTEEEIKERRLCPPAPLDGTERTLMVLALCALVAGLLSSLATRLAVYFAVVCGVVLLRMVGSSAQDGAALQAVGVHVFGIIWLALFPSMAITLVSLPNGGGVSLLALAGASFADVAAFYVGSRVGRFKVIPHVSKGKTLEGALRMAAGVAMSVALHVLFWSLRHVPGLDMPDAGVWGYAVLGVWVAVFDIFGDLVESLVKRSCRVKDSGTAFTGHGGVLDRFDAYFFSFPATLALYASWLSFGRPFF